MFIPSLEMLMNKKEPKRFQNKGETDVKKNYTYCINSM